MRNHMRYGPNLKDLYNPFTQEMNLAAFFKGKNIKRAYDPDQFQVGNVAIYWDQWQSFFFAMTLSLQYNNQSISNCFHSVVDTLDSFDYINQDIDTFLTTFNYYNLVFYDPFHIYGNIMATYE